MPDNGLENIEELTEIEAEEPAEIEVKELPPVITSRRRRMGFTAWWRSRSGAWDLFDSLTAGERRRAGLPQGAWSVDYLGKAMWVVFVLIVISGIGLLAGYVPTVSGAFSSVERIQNEMSLGWWFRGVHKWGTDLFIILGILRLVRLAYRRGYKSTGEFTWIWALLVLAIGMAAGLTGYLLVWHQRAFWMGSVLQSDPMASESVQPLGGLGLKGWVAERIVGGVQVTQSALTIIFVIHIALGFIVLLSAFCLRLIARRLVPKYRHFSLCIPPGLVWAILGFLTFIALILPPPVGGPSDGILTPMPILSDWYFLGCYQLIGALTPTIAGWLIGIGFLVGFLLPWIDRSRAKGARPAVTLLIAAGLLTWLIFTLKALGWAVADYGILVITALVWLIALILAAMAEYRPRKAESDESEGEVVPE